MKPAFITIPKKKNYRDRHLLNMARGKPCLFQIKGVCNHDPATTVSCHSNQSIHGKGMSIKAHDAYSAWGCSSCHAEIDQGMMSKEERDHIFLTAHMRQVIEWGKIIHSEYCNRKDRASISGALEFLVNEGQ